MALVDWRAMSLRRLTLALLGAATLACGPTQQQEQAHREEIRQVVAAYLPKLAEAYATGDARVLAGLAVEKEVASVAKSIDDLAGQGLAFRPRLKQLTLEDVTVWRQVNAYVTTMEVWDIDKLVLGTDRVLSQALDRSDRVRYQLKRREGTWQVLYREVERPPE
jgi:hypothetical protein